MARGETTLGLRLIQFYQQFFTYCGRRSVSLTPDVARSLLSGNEAYEHMEFQLNGGCSAIHLQGGGYRGKPQRRGFYMALLTPPAKEECRGRYSAIAEHWKAELILEHPFENEFA